MMTPYSRGVDSNLEISDQISLIRSSVRQMREICWEISIDHQSVSTYCMIPRYDMICREYIHLCILWWWAGWWVGKSTSSRRSRVTIRALVYSFDHDCQHIGSDKLTSRVEVPENMKFAGIQAPEIRHTWRIPNLRHERRLGTRTEVRHLCHRTRRWCEYFKYKNETINLKMWPSFVSGELLL